MSLNNKRILFLSANLFGYQKEIKQCIEQQGAIVDYFDERPSNTFFVKALIRINRNLISKYIDNYHSKIIKKTCTNKYDFIFITKGESISVETLRQIKYTHSSAKLIIYHWDSIANNKNAINTLPLFDRIFSFDKPDCTKLGIEFLPLFYLNDYRCIADKSLPKPIDLLFIGTVHSDRHRFIQNIAKQIESRGLKSFLYFYFPSPLLYYKTKLSDKTLANTTMHDFFYKPLTKQQIIDLYQQSQIIIDVQHPKQTGLTMRCIEALGAKKKMITTNTHIKEYDFYNKNNILIVDRNNPVITDHFINSPYQEISNAVYKKYSIENWIQTILK